MIVATGYAPECIEWFRGREAARREAAAAWETARMLIMAPGSLDMILDNHQRRIDVHSDPWKTAIDRWFPRVPDYKANVVRNAETRPERELQARASGLSLAGPANDRASGGQQL